jgi:hypothetical protein
MSPLDGFYVDAIFNLKTSFSALLVLVMMLFIAHGLQEIPRRRTSPNCVNVISDDGANRESLA